MATNNFLPFTPTDTGTNLLTQGEYAVATDRTNGNQPGVASSKLNNKAIRQANVIASQVAQYLSDKMSTNALDDGNLANILALMNSGFAPLAENTVENLTMATAVGASALTISVKTQAGANASATDLIYVGMRDATLTSGLFTRRSISAALSLVISSGSTLGQVSGQPSVIWVYLLDNAGTLELAASHSKYSEDTVVSTTAEGGAGAADSPTVIYSTTARSNVPIRLIGYILNTQATAGTWASAGTQLQLLPTQRRVGPTIQTFLTGGASGTYITPAGSTRLRVRMAGGGGGGGSKSAAGDGGTTTFGSSLLTCTGGIKGSQGGASGAGGTATINSPAVQIVRLAGGLGGAAGNIGGSGASKGGIGGTNPFGGAGGESIANASQNAGGAAAANTGAGGGGGSVDNSSGSQSSSSGGGAGAYVEAIILNPAASYAYGVGDLGAGGAGDADNGAGGNGGTGAIIVEEFYD